MNDDLPPIPKRYAKRGPFATLLREERARLGLNQHEAARIMGVSDRTVEMWETDKNQPLAITQEGALARLYAQPSPVPQKVLTECEQVAQ